MTGAHGYIHHIDPIIGSIAGVHLWWYGLSFVLGFGNIFLTLRHRRGELGFSQRMVYDLTLLVAVGVLVGGRGIEVAFYEWPFYRAHPGLIPAVWLGGMATHGLLLGGIAGTVLFCWAYRTSFLGITDALAAPAAFILTTGRIGNFIDGQILGSVTDAWWGVKFPDAEGFRHPVVLYDGLKNLLLVPLLLHVTKKRLPRGTTTGLFLVLYAGLRIFIDVFRVYPTTLLGLATGQSLNLVMAIVGLVLLAWCLRTRQPEPIHAYEEGVPSRFHALQGPGLWWRKGLFAALVLFVLTIPSDWTQDVPTRYGARHPGLQHSVLYPPIPPVPTGPTGSRDALGHVTGAEGGSYPPVAGYPGFQHAVLPQ